jgi:transposase
VPAAVAPPAEAVPIALAAEERAELQRRVRARTSRQQDVLRARIVLLAADGLSNSAIAAALGITRFTARRWRGRFAAARVAGLGDRPHCPPPRRYGPEVQARIVVLACQSPAEVGWPGQSHWTVRDLAAYLAEHPELGLGAPSPSTVHRILQAHDICLDRL